jgi:hypothetical protein
MTNTFPRRSFLRGLGASLAIPHLVSLSGKSMAAGGLNQAPLRMAFFSIPNGVQQDHWFPTGEGSDYTLNESMTPLQPLKDRFQVISGLMHQNATPGNDGAGDHARANATFLTGARARKTAGKDIQVGVSVDQVAAQAIGHQTRLRSLELSCDAIRNSGSCDSGYACAYQYNLSWSSPTTPVTPEPNPRFVFERLFGAGEHGQRQKNFQVRQQSSRSVIDFVLEDAQDVQRSLGKNDRQKLDEYLSSVREIEKTLKASEQFQETPDPDQATPEGIPQDFAQHLDMMTDLMWLAFQTDSTRVATLLMAYDGSNRTFANLGITEGHHYLTHNQRVPELAKKVAAIDRFYVERFARFLLRMEVTLDSDGHSMLHNSMIVYGGAIADGNRHTHANLPVILAGSGGGRIKTGRHLKVEDTPMANLFVEMLNQFDIPTESFGDSTDRLPTIVA